MKATGAILALGLLLLAAAAGAQTYVGGSISANTDWTLANSPYVVQSSISIIDGATLTIEPGVEVRFDPATGMEVTTGTLSARGTSGARILFTSSLATPPATDAERWQTIRFADGAADATYDAGGSFTGGCVLEYATIEYAGNGNLRALNVIDSAPFVSHGLLRDNRWGGIYAEGSEDLRIDSTTVDAVPNYGAVRLKAVTDAKLTNNVFSNSFTFDGGGLVVDGGQRLTLTGNAFTDNSVSNAGGGVHLRSLSYATVADNIITGNTALGGERDGGGLYIKDSEHLTITGNTITGNTANDHGGGVFITDSQHVALSGNTISGNNAIDYGDGLYLSNVDDMTMAADRVVANSGTGLWATAGCDNLVLSATPADPTWVHGNTTWDVYNDMVFSGSPDPQGAGNIDGRHVYWGTLDGSQVPALIYDHVDDPAKGIVLYEPIGVPEPSCALLVMLGIWALRRRR